MASVCGAAAAGMATGTANSDPVILEAHIVVEFDAAVAVFDRKIIIGGTARLIGMTGVALVCAIVAGGDSTIGVTGRCCLVAQSHSDNEPDATEIAMTIGALGAVAAAGGCAPPALPGAAIVVTAGHCPRRTAGRRQNIIQETDICSQGDDWAAVAEYAVRMSSGRNICMTGFAGSLPGIAVVETVVVRIGRYARPGMQSAGRSVGGLAVDDGQNTSMAGGAFDGSRAGPYRLAVISGGNSGAGTVTWIADGCLVISHIVDRTVDMVRTAAVVGMADRAG